MSDLFSLEPNQLVQTIETNINNDNSFLNINSKAKELTKQIDWVLTQRKSEYLHEILFLQTHKSVAIRRKIASGIAFIAGKEIINSIKQWQNIEPDRQTWLILETLADKLSRGIEINKQTDIKILTVSEALVYIKKLLGEGIYCIEGELSEVRPFRNMFYFALKDKQEGRINCWAFEKVIERIDFPFNEGLSVRITGKFKLSKDSKLYFDTQNIQLTGQGELLRNLKQLETKLQNEGLFDEKRKRPICQIPQNILLIASPNSAALTDFIKVVSHRRGGINIYLLPIKTQGASAEALILEQLEKVNIITNKLNIDTIVITRGGGSQDDLFVFNSEKIVRSIHGLNKPTIVAIGHERDTTLAEMVADLRCSTPSQAAEKVSLSRHEIMYQVNSIIKNIYTNTLEKIHLYQSYTQKVLTNIHTLLKSRMENAKFICNHTTQLATNITSQARFETITKWRNINQVIQLNISQTKNFNEKINTSIYQLFISSFNQTKNNFKLVSSQIFMHDPKNILAKGYALILQNNEIKENIVQIDQSSPMKIQMQDGEIEAVCKS